MKMVQKKTHNIIFKPYSKDILGYVARLTNCRQYIVINSNLSNIGAKMVHAKMLSLSSTHPSNSFILLQSDGNVQKSEYYQSTETSEAS